jgi:hypothetical protein
MKLHRKISALQRIHAKGLIEGAYEAQKGLHHTVRKWAHVVHLSAASWLP